MFWKREFVKGNREFVRGKRELVRGKANLKGGNAASHRTRIDRSLVV